MKNYINIISTENCKMLLMVAFLFLAKNEEFVHFPSIVSISHNMYETHVLPMEDLGFLFTIRHFISLF